MRVIILMVIFTIIGWNIGIAGYSWAKWLMIPAISLLFGAMVRMFWN